MSSFAVSLTAHAEDRFLGFLSFASQTTTTSRCPFLDAITLPTRTYVLDDKVLVGLFVYGKKHSTSQTTTALGGKFIHTSFGDLYHEPQTYMHYHLIIDENTLRCHTGSFARNLS